jgi:methionyl-tRNA formyltransferase
MSLRIVFLGTGDFAVPALKALHADGHRLVQVICQPDRPKGRGHHLQAPPVKLAAQALGLDCWQPEKLRDPAAVERFEALGADLACVVAYGQILPQRVLDAPRLGCLNVHASLLPRWRGAAPIEWALAEGDPETGVCVQQMVFKLDAGAVLKSWRRPVTDTDEAPALHQELAQRGSELLRQTVAALEAGPLAATAQDEAGVTLAPLLKKADGYLDPAWPRRKLLNRVRAFKARPGAHLDLDGVGRLRILGLADGGSQHCGEAGSLAGSGPDGLKMACADGAVWIKELQAPGAKAMPAADFARGRRLAAGARFTRPAD